MLIGGSAFYQCSSLTEVLLTGGLTILGGGMFNMGVTTLLPLITIPSTVTSTGRDYYYHYYYLIMVYIKSQCTCLLNAN